MDPAAMEHLANAGLNELRAEWERRHGAAPRLRSVDLLRRILTWRIQAGEQGGLDKATRRLLDGTSTSPEALLADGTRLAREWKGVRHEVEVADGGFIYGGKRWNSLSEVARNITGKRWNGPRFFGLRNAS